MHRFAKLLVPVSCIVLAACATMVNPGKHRTTPEGRMARVQIRGDGRFGGGALQFAVDTSRLAIYDNGVRVQVYDAGRESRQGLMDACSRLSVSGCGAVVLVPAIQLDRTRPHTLRVVFDGREATRTMNAGMHWQWIWLNGVWMVGAPIGWVADFASGRMKYFGNLDLKDLFGAHGAGTN